MRRIPVSAVAKALSGESSCLYRMWWELRNSTGRPSDAARLAAWNVKHGEAVQDLAEKVEGDLEAEVVVSDESGISGRVDLVQTKDGQAFVHEVKTGRASGSDIVQLMLYIALLRVRRANVAGGFLHRASGSTWVPVADVPGDLLERACRVAHRLATATPPPRIRERACFWCVASCPFSTVGEKDARAVRVVSASEATDVEV